MRKNSVIKLMNYISYINKNKIYIILLIIEILIKKFLKIKVKFVNCNKILKIKYFITHNKKTNYIIFKGIH